MGSLNDVLKVLADEKFREVRLSISDLSKETGSSEDTLRKQLSTLKHRDYADGNAKEGWAITSEGRSAFERQVKISLTPQDVGADTESKLIYYGQLASVPGDLAIATIELILAGDPEDLEHVWNCMTEMDVPIAGRKRWFALWRNYLKQGIPPNLRERVIGTSEEEPGGGDDKTPALAKRKTKDYIIVDDLPVFVGPDQGDYPLQDAKEIINSRALKARFAGLGSGGGGSGGQGWGPEGIAKLLAELRKPDGGGATAKIYAIEQGEQGAIVREVKPGEPLNLNPPGDKKSQPLLVIDSEGIVQEFKPGMRVGAKPPANNPPPQKITLVRQTDKGLVKEEFTAGETIILNNPPPGSAGISGMLMPAFKADGTPLLDEKGNPVYANAEQTMKWMGFLSDQKRASEKHDAVIGLFQTGREKLGDGIDALREAAAELRRGSKAAPPPGTSAQAEPAAAETVYQCGNCPAQFKLPTTGDWKIAVCPNCKAQYTREQVEKA